MVNDKNDGRAADDPDIFQGHQVRFMFRSRETEMVIGDGWFGVLASARTATTQKIRQTYMKALGPIFGDDQLLEIATEEDNIERLKDHLLTVVLLQGYHSVIEFRITGKTLTEIVNDIKKSFPERHISGANTQDFIERGYHMTARSDPNMDKFIRISCFVQYAALEQPDCNLTVSDTQ